MVNNINQQVIDFTAVYTGEPPENINDSTTLVSIGITTREDLINYITDLEDNFGLTYEQGDENGIETVGDAAALIIKKLH